MQHVTIQLVTWNSAAALRESLPTLARIDSAAARICVIDNASTDESVDLVKQHVPHAELIRLPENTGFAGGHNAGFARCTTPLVVTLNPDVQLHWLGLEAVITAFDDERVAAAQGLLMRDNTKVDSAGIVLTPAFNGRDRGAGQEDRGVFSQVSALDAVTGACAVYRVSALRAIAHGGHEVFDADFWAYKEDVDLGWRLQRAGWKMLFVPSVVGTHPRSLKPESAFGWRLTWSSVGERLRDPRTRYSWRNWVWMMAKNASLINLIVHGVPIAGRMTVMLVLSALYWPLFGVLLEAARGIPRMVAKRRYWD